MKTTVMMMDHGTDKPSSSNPPDSGGAPLECGAEEHLDATLSLFRTVVGSEGGPPIELFRKSAWRWRATRGAIEPQVKLQFGVEHGVAVRIAVDDRTCAFAAASGAGIDAVRTAHRLAMGGSFAAAEPEPFWAPGAGRPDWDADPIGASPDGATLEAWVKGLEKIDGTGLPRTAATDVWVEFAVTIESLVATGGLQACRRRARSWATRRVGDEVRTAAARGVELPNATALAGPWRSPAPIPEGRRGRRVTASLAPEPAAALVAALVPAIHGNGSDRGRPVGRGWNLEDHPDLPSGIGGGSFDDAGFPSKRVTLADGGVVQNVLGGPGHQVRGSYRTPPAARFTNLTVVARPDGAPRADVAVDWLRLHAISPNRWVAEFRGNTPAADQRIYGMLGLGDPYGLVQRCIAASGPVVATALGVVCPTLTFEGLVLS